MRATAILFFFAIAGLGYLAVLAAHRLQVRYRQDYLPAWTVYVGAWSALAALAVLQFVTVQSFVPSSSLELLLLALSPLMLIVLAVALYALSSFLARLAGRTLPRTFRIAFAGACVVIGAMIVAASAGGPTRHARISTAGSAVVFVFRTALVYGGIAVAFARVRRLDDPLERVGLQRVLAWLLCGFLAFDLALRDVLSPLGVRSTDYVLGTLNVAVNFPALAALGGFLRRYARERPAPAVPADLAALLSPHGVSGREAEVVELVMRGLSNKEIAARLFISVDTVKKHTYNVYRKLGVQNRVQLSYFVRNLAPGPTACAGPVREESRPGQP